MHTRVLKELADSKLLAIIFENSRRLGEVPDDMKRSNIVPILKKLVANLVADTLSRGF